MQVVCGAVAISLCLAAVAVGVQVKTVSPLDGHEVPPKLEGEAVCLDWTMEVLFVQDVSYSFTDDMDMMKVKADKMLGDIATTFPGAKMGLVTFVDKPHPGRPGNFCYRLNSEMTTNFTALGNTMKNLTTYPNNDYPESQLDAMFNGLTSEKVGWSKSATDAGHPILQVVVLITDAPYFKADDLGNRNYMNVTPVAFETHPGGLSEVDCTKFDYPAEQQVRDAFEERNAIPLVLVGGGEKDVIDLYTNFTRSIHQHGSVMKLEDDSSDLIQKLMKGLKRLSCVVPIPAKSVVGGGAVGGGGSSVPINAIIIGSALGGVVVVGGVAGLAYLQHQSNTKQADWNFETESPADREEDRDTLAVIDADAFA